MRRTGAAAPRASGARSFPESRKRAKSPPRAVARASRTPRAGLVGEAEHRDVAEPSVADVAEIGLDRGPVDLAALVALHLHAPDLVVEFAVVEPRFDVDDRLVLTDASLVDVRALGLEVVDDEPLRSPPPSAPRRAEPADRAAHHRPPRASRPARAWSRRSCLRRAARRHARRRGSRSSCADRAANLEPP